MPLWNVPSSVGKMAPGTYQGWKGAQPTPRQIPRRPPGANLASAFVCDHETVTDAFTGGAGDLAHPPWNVGAGFPTGLQLDGSGHLVNNAATASATYDHQFGETADLGTPSGHRNFQIDALIAAWTLAAGGGGAYQEFHLVARKLTSGAGGSASYVELYVEEGVGNIPVTATWTLFSSSGLLATVSSAAPTAGDTVTLLVEDSAVSGQLNGSDIVTSTMTPTPGGYAGILAGEQTNGGGTATLQVNSMSIQNLC